MKNIVQPPYETVVHVNYDMPGDFRDQLNTKADAFETSFGPATIAMDKRVAAYAETVDRINQGGRAGRNNITATPAKLAAQINANHVEKPRKKKAQRHSS